MAEPIGLETKPKETKSKKAVEKPMPSAVRILENVRICGEMSVIAFTKDQIVDDPYVVPLIVRSEAKYEPC